MKLARGASAGWEGTSPRRRPFRGFHAGTATQPAGRFPARRGLFPIGNHNATVNSGQSTHTLNRVVSYWAPHDMTLRRGLSSFLEGTAARHRNQGEHITCI